MFHETFPDEPLTVLVDYYAREVADSLAVAARFPELAAAGRLAVRIDTHGGRFVEGLDTASSYAVLERYAPRGDPHVSHGDRAALAGRDRRQRRGYLSPARRARCRGARRREDRCQLGLRARQVPADGGGRRADRYRRHRFVPARAVVGDLRGGRRRRLRRRARRSRSAGSSCCRDHPAPGARLTVTQGSGTRSTSSREPVADVDELRQPVPRVVAGHAILRP